MIQRDFIFDKGKLYSLAQIWQSAFKADFPPIKQFDFGELCSKCYVLRSKPDEPHDFRAYIYLLSDRVYLFVTDLNGHDLDVSWDSYAFPYCKFCLKKFIRDESRERKYHHGN